MCKECDNLKAKIKRFIKALFEKWDCNEKHNNSGCGFCPEGIVNKKPNLGELCEIEDEYISALGELQQVAREEVVELLKRRSANSSD